jgi:hypothetical protein
MILAALIELVWSVNAERKPLEAVASPLPLSNDSCSTHDRTADRWEVRTINP